MAVLATEEHGRVAGLAGTQGSAMDRAYRAVAASAGEAAPGGYFADDGPQSDWEPAATLAAEVAGAIIGRSVIDAVMFDFIIAPWFRLLREERPE